MINEIIKHAEKVDDWANRVSPKCIGELSDNHAGVAAGLIDSDAVFNNKLKGDKVIVEDVLNRWVSSSSQSVLVAKSKAKSKIKEMDGNRYLLLQVQLDRDNKPFGEK